MNINQLLLEEMECKKDYKANHDFRCGCCNEFIIEDDLFWFFGNGIKVCEECYDEIINFIKNN